MIALHSRFQCFIVVFILHVDTLQSSYAMVLLPLACQPLEYLRGRFTNEEKQQDRVHVGNIIMLMFSKMYLFFVCK